MVTSAAIATLGYLISVYFENIWLGYFILLAVSTVFIATLMGRSKAYFESIVSYRVVTGLAFLLILAHVIAFALDYNRRDFQKELVLEIRHRIDEGVAKSEIQGSLLYALSRYKVDEYSTVMEAYKSEYGERLAENGVYISDFDIEKPEGFDDDEMDYYYEIDEANDEITITVATIVSNGEDPEFQNKNGQTGKYEIAFTLNKQGVNYEVLN